MAIIKYLKNDEGEESFKKIKYKNLFNKISFIAFMVFHILYFLILIFNKEGVLIVSV